MRAKDISTDQLPIAETIADADDTAAKVEEVSNIATRFIFLKELQSGKQGQVWVAYDIRNARKVALKVMHDANVSKRELHALLAVRKIKDECLRHVVCYHQLLHEEPTSTSFLSIELIDGPDFFDWTDSLAARERLPNVAALVGGFFQQLMPAVNLLHRNKIFHLDIKPENIVVESVERLVLVDFGLSCVAQIGADISVACDDVNLGGTVGYSYPRYLNECVRQNECEFPRIYILQDYFSLAMTLLVLFDPMASDKMQMLAESAFVEGRNDLGVSEIPFSKPMPNDKLSRRLRNLFHTMIIETESLLVGDMAQEMTLEQIWSFAQKQHKQKKKHSSVDESTK